MINFQTGIESNDRALVEYERLRFQASTRQEGFSEPTLGLTLFILQGMLAWIEVCHRCLPAISKQEKQQERSCFAYQETSEMIKVMANITLFNLEEAHS